MSRALEPEPALLMPSECLGGLRVITVLVDRWLRFLKGEIIGAHLWTFLRFDHDLKGTMTWIASRTL